MALHEQTEARLVGFDELAASVQIETLRAIESDLRRALSADVPADANVPGGPIRVAHEDLSDA